jgi:hypothetical protein
LRVKLAKIGLERIRRYPAPTYLFGVDNIRAVSFIAAILEVTPKNLSSVPTAYPLNDDNRRKLWYEVRDFWDSRDMRMTESVFRM